MRYKDTFEVKKEDATVLLERIKLLLQKVEKEFAGIVQSIKVPSNEIEI